MTTNLTTTREVGLRGSERVRLTVGGAGMNRRMQDDAFQELLDDAYDEARVVAKLTIPAEQRTTDEELRLDLTKELLRRDLALNR